MNVIQLIQLIIAGIFIASLVISLETIIEAILNYRVDSKKNFPPLTDLDKSAIIIFTLYSLFAIIGLLSVLYT